MSKINFAITIDAPIAKTWEVLGDFPNVYKWSPAVTASSAVPGHERGSDAVRVCEVPGFGTVDETVTDWTEGHGFTYEIVATGPIKTAVSDWRLRSEDGKTVADVAVNFKVRFGALGSVMDRLVMRRMMKRALVRTLAGLKYYVETGNEVGGRLPDGVGTENVREAAETVDA